MMTRMFLLCLEERRYSFKKFRFSERDQLRKKLMSEKSTLKT